MAKDGVFELHSGHLGLNPEGTRAQSKMLGGDELCKYLPSLSYHTLKVYVLLLCLVCNNRVTAFW